MEQTHTPTVTPTQTQAAPAYQPAAPLQSMPARPGNAHVQPSGTPTAPGHPALTPKRKKLPLVIGALVVIVLLAGGGAAALWLPGLMAPEQEVTEAGLMGTEEFEPVKEFNSEELAAAEAERMQNPLSLDGWNTHASQRYAYQFQYPGDWVFGAYDEENVEIQFGSHALYNYDYNQVNQYMDSGIVNWSGFLGETPALKLDISVRQLSEAERETFETQLVSSESTAPISWEMADMLIGTNPTKFAMSADTTQGQEIRTYVAYPSAESAVIVSVYGNNLQGKSLSELSEWQSIQMVLNSFIFSK